MTRSKAKNALTARNLPARPDASSLAEKISWYALLTMVALAPIFSGSYHLQSGQRFIGMFDSAGLPKLFVIVVCVSVGLIAQAVVVLRSADRSVRWHRSAWPVLALLAWAVVVTGFSLSPRLSIFGEYRRNEGLVAYFAYAGTVVLAVQHLRSVKRARVLAVAAVVSGASVALHAVLQSIGLDPFVWAGETAGLGRAFATFGNPIMLGTYLVFPLMLAVGLAFDEAKPRRAAAYWGVVMLLVSGLVVTLTRGAWLGAAAGGLVFALLAWRSGARPGRVQVVGLSVSGAALMVALVLNAPRIISRFTAGGSGVGGADNGRLVAWKAGLGAAADKPLTGWGLDSFGRAVMHKDLTELFRLSGNVFPDNSHNVLMQWLVSMGTPGLLLALVAVVWPLIAYSKRFSKSGGGPGTALMAAFPAGLVAVFVGLQTGVVMPPVETWLWLAVGCCIGMLASRSVAAEAKNRWAATLGGYTVAGISIGLMVLVTMWFAGDVIYGRALMSNDASTVPGIRVAQRLNPFAQQYFVSEGEFLGSQAAALSNSGFGGSTLKNSLDKAIRAFDSAAERDRGDIRSRTYGARLLLEAEKQFPGNGYGPRAVSRAEEAVDLAPHDWRALEVYGSALLRANARSQGAAMLRRAAAAAPPESASMILSNIPTDTAPAQ